MPTLDTLKTGDRATILEITGSDGISTRLMEMGLIDGEEIEVIGFAPLGDPIEFEVRGYRFVFRRQRRRRRLRARRRPLPFAQRARKRHHR